jgi:ABC-type lipoprotein export system ATPase subunit
VNVEIDSRPLLEARGVYHIYRSEQLETIAVRGTDITVAAGQWVSVVGPSGSGKSTLLNILGGLVTPSAGEVLLDGEDIGRLDEPSRAKLRRTKLGVMLQRDNLHPLLTVRENVALPLQLSGSPFAERTGELIERVGLRDRARHRPHQLSGGEAQRASIAVALAGRPKLLLADEPTGELDEATSTDLLDLLDNIRRADGLALITVTHNPDVAARAEVRLAMADGVLHEEIVHV